MFQKVFMVLYIFILSTLCVFADEIEDNSIIDELSEQNTVSLEHDFTLKTFDSCQVFEDVMEEYLKEYWEHAYSQPMLRRGMVEPVMMMDMAVEESAADTAVQSKSSANAGGEISQTNTQVLGVDEADIVKTDGNYHYYYNDTEKTVYIIKVEKARLFSEEKLETVKKIHIPERFYGVELFVTDNRLVILASGYSENIVSRDFYRIGGSNKTYAVVFDTTSKSQPDLLELQVIDGNKTQVRRIGDYVYIVSQNYFNYPFWNVKHAEDIDLQAIDLLPQKLSAVKTDVVAEQNLELKGKTLPYSLEVGAVADCQSISYSLPDVETMKNLSFNPGYTLVTALNINSTSEQTKTHVIAGNASEIHMSHENLYLTEGIWQPGNFRCPPNMICTQPMFWGGSQNTLLHKLNIDNEDMNYQNSTLVPGSPLTQYSMDEHDGNFRIITSQWQPERSTAVYILDENLKALSSLTNLAPGETFQSSRFMGDKLFLVTFEQIDPLFAIDLGDPEFPEVLGELKIPGFSTYLHPYDDTRLIGLGYDTDINQWGGTERKGVKIDLYRMHYDKRCGGSGLTAEQEKKCESGDYKGIIVEQEYSEVFGGKGSYSEALDNPRMFMWNKTRNTLLLPVSLYEKDDNWRTTDYYNGLLSVNIDTNSGITENGRASHIDVDQASAERIEECSQYGNTDSEPVCKRLINGELYCEEPEIKRGGYVPNYCFEDGNVWQYIGDRSWEYRDMHLKRALYIGESVYGFSDSHVGIYDWNLEPASSLEF